ncbi:NADP-dependent oxidoreductase domain-containing protein [Xylariaceae sp. FL1272]|nr:NADP-dependent oxidoreductase domain-containing protein [Xylariaceae sp. FL1272]
MAQGQVRKQVAFQLAPPPVGPLNRYRLLSPTAAVRVSPLCLGTMNFGDKWAEDMGECSQETAEGIMDFYFEQGGNFIDTANNYQFQDSEKWVGEWIKKRGNRDQIVLATKYTTNYKCGPQASHLMANYSGNGTKSMVNSVEQSLKNLQTNYLDILYVHWWDYSTSITELMQSLNHLVVSGKVLYLGISDTPAWVVSRANEYARQNGLRQFSVYQGNWSAALRDMERDIIPMCKHEGMALIPFGVMGSGRFKTKEERDADPGRTRETSETERAVADVLGTIAKRKGEGMTALSVALAYVFHKAPYVFPVIGGRKVEHLKGNIAALTLSLTPEEIDEIEAAAPFDPGFPHNLVMPKKMANPLQDLFVHVTSATMDWVPEPKPIAPAPSKAQ